ncbi:hypothetical protein ACFL2G_00530 [Candidatus Omnitrophota bacterium]
MKRSRILDYILLASLVSFITIQPHFMHGAINFYETGLYLPSISQLFHGAIPYKDMFVMRGPLEILMPAFLMSVLGKHIGVLNAYFYFGTVLTLIIYAFFALRIFNTRGFAYLFTMVLTARTFPRVTFNMWGGIRFGLGILALLLAVNFLRKKRKTWLLMAGIVSGLAFWTSFEIGTFSFVAIFAMLGFLGYFEKDVKVFAKGLFTYALGSFLVFIPFLLYLLLNKAFLSYSSTLKVVLTGMTDVFDASLSFETPRNFKEFLFALSPLNHSFKYTLPFLFYLSIGVYQLRRILRKNFSIKDLSITPLFIYGVFLYQGSFRDIEGPQYRMALQPVLLIMFFYLERLYVHVKNMKYANGFKKAVAFFFIIMVPFYSVMFSLYKYNKRFFIFREIKSYVKDKRPLDIPYAGPEPRAITSIRAKGVIVPMHQAEEIDGVVEYIISNTKRDDTVFTFPDMGTYNFLTDRPPLGKFYAAELSFFHPEWFEEMMTELRGKRPEFVICAKYLSRLEQFRPTVGAYIDEVMEFLDNNYEIAREYDKVNVLKLKEDAGY